MLFKLICQIILSLLMSNNDTNKLDPASSLGTHTAYRECPFEAYRPKDSLFENKQCTLVSLNVVLRHGSRSCSFKNSKQFKDLQQKFLESAVKEGATIPYEILFRPTPFDRLDKEQQLLPSGYREHQLLGRFFSALANRSGNFELQETNTVFFTSSKQRAVDSSRAFQDGLFGPDRPHVNVMRRDDLLRFYAFCSRYQQSVKRNKTASRELKKFASGPEMRFVLDKLVARFDLDADNYSTADVLTIVNICSYQLLQLNVTPSKLPAWCLLLDPEDFLVAEYMMDLKSYWLKSYAHEVNYVPSCPLLSSMLTHLSQSAELYSSKQFDKIKRGVFYFAHAETVLPLVTLLGLANDSFQLDAVSFSRHLARVKAKSQPPTLFRASNLVPMAGNVGLALFHCDNNGESDASDPLANFRVEVMSNGRSIAWPLASRPTPGPRQHKVEFGLHTPLSNLVNTYQFCSPESFDEAKECSIKAF